MSPSPSDTYGEQAGSRDRNGHALHLALIVGLGGIFGIFLIAGVEAIHLLHELQSENKVLHKASVERSRHLAAIPYYATLSETYFTDYLLDPDAGRSINHRNRLQDAWARMEAGLREYRTTMPEERILIVQLQQLLQQDWQQMVHVMSQLDGAPQRQVSASFYGEQVLPLRATVIEISARVEDIDSRQLVSTEEEIQRKSDGVGRRLGLVLNISLATALVLAAGCLAYILRLEGQNRARYQETLQARRELEQLSARLVTAQEEERRSISRELHDEVGQTLSAVLVDAANLSKRLSGQDLASQRYLDSIRAHVNSSVNSIRDIALLLRPSMLDDLGLIPALEWQAREISRRGDLKVKVVAENVSEPLNDLTRTCIYRIAQEALNNVARHSEALHATISVRGTNNSLVLTVEDDGKGFDPARTRGLGLLGMEERVRQLGGRLQIQSGPETRTILQVELPLPQAVT